MRFGLICNFFSHMRNVQRLKNWIKELKLDTKKYKIKEFVRNQLGFEAECN